MHRKDYCDTRELYFLTAGVGGEGEGGPEVLLPSQDGCSCLLPSCAVNMTPAGLLHASLGVLRAGSGLPAHLAPVAALV